MKNQNFIRTYISMRGFTLIEMMVVVVILGILVSIAYPSYTSYLLKSRRAEAKSMLQEIQLRQEKYRANNSSYGSLSDLGWTQTLTHYNLDIPNSSVSGSSYSIQANAKTGSSQLNDMQGSTNCKNLAINQSGKTPPACW